MKRLLSRLLAAWCREMHPHTALLKEGDGYRCQVCQQFTRAPWAVERTDGSSAPGGKHHGCRYFVLDITHDPHGIPALLAYADSCEAEYPQLAIDIRAMVQGRDDVRFVPDWNFIRQPLPHPPDEEPNPQPDALAELEREKLETFVRLYNDLTLDQVKAALGKAGAR